MDALEQALELLGLGGSFGGPRRRIGDRGRGSPSSLAPGSSAQIGNPALFRRLPGAMATATWSRADRMSWTTPR